MPTKFVNDFSCNGTFIDAHDGDSIHIVMDRGLFDYKGTPDHPQMLRLNGIAARELSDEGGKEARDHIEAVFKSFARDTAIGLYTIKPYKYGSTLVADVYFLDGQGRKVCLNTLLVVCGFATTWDGEGKQPKPAWPRTKECLHA